MINVQKVKKGLGKCWKFFAAKPAYAASRYQCAYCGWVSSQRSTTTCPKSPGGHGPHCWVPID